MARSSSQARSGSSSGGPRRWPLSTSAQVTTAPPRSSALRRAATSDDVHHLVVGAVDEQHRSPGEQRGVEGGVAVGEVAGDDRDGRRSHLHASGRGGWPGRWRRPGRSRPRPCRPPVSECCTSKRAEELCERRHAVAQRALVGTVDRRPGTSRDRRESRREGEARRRASADRGRRGRGWSVQVEGSSQKPGSRTRMRSATPAAGRSTTSRAIVLSRPGRPRPWRRTSTRCCRSAPSRPVPGAWRICPSPTYRATWLGSPPPRPQ